MRLRVASLLFALCFASSLCAAEVTWKMHTINAQSEFPACAAFDIDHDGDIDIYCGGFWYEAPSWKQHKVRDVEVIRGRYDDYSNQPLDCNGDGWTDIISVNYRSETIYWIEHPGQNLGKQDWVAHVIDKPGPSETGRLHDIDGDGDLDILPNGTTYAAWYEFAPVKQDDGTLEPKWVKHDLPKEMAGHGIGFARGQGELEGDAVAIWATASMVFQAPRSIPERLAPFAPEGFFSLHKDAGVPILIHDVDGKYGEDLIWGRGHRTGLYWSMRRTRQQTNWRMRPIDTSWSQCHAPLMSDIDGDGIDDLVAGKRYMGHEGKDPGEYDPLVIYWYKFDNERGTWKRNIVQQGGPAGIDLDTKVIDLDGDGDTDIVAPSRNGLYLFENLLKNSQGVVPDRSPIEPLSAYQDHATLLLYATDSHDLRPVKTPAEWARRRWHIIKGMEVAMGTLPEPNDRIPVALGHPLECDAEPIGQTDKYERIRLRFRAHSHDPQAQTALLLVPHERRHGNDVPLLPAMLCLHPTSIEHGKKIVTGEVEAKNRNYAHELAERGYVCICPDYPTMGENPFDLQTTHKHFESGTMKAIWDNVRCLDVLESLPYVGPDRIGVIGHSLGGHNGMFTACFDQRIQCVVTSCGFTPFHDYYGGKLDGWAQDRYMPKIRTVYNNNPDKMPFDFYEVLGAIAPRPIFINAPLHDDNFDVNGVKKGVLEAGKVYDLLGKKQGIEVRYPDCAHDFPTEVREEVYQWLDKQLK